MIDLGPLEAIAPEGAKGYEVGEHSVVVVRRGAVVHAYLNRCPHLGVELNWMPDQFLDRSGRLLQCATHGALFEPDTGYCIAGPCRGKSLPRVACAVQGGHIAVTLLD